MKKGTKILAVVITVCLAMLGFSLTSLAAPQNFLTADFSSLVDPDTSWQAAAHEFKDLCVDPELHGILNPGIYNVSAAGVGYIVYKLDAGEGKKFDTMKLSWVGRIFDVTAGADAYLSLQVSADGGDYQLVKKIAAVPDNGDPGQAFSESFDTYVKGAGTVLVKIEMKSNFWSWVGIKSLSIDGTTESVDTGVDTTGTTTTAETDATTPASEADATTATAETTETDTNSSPTDSSATAAETDTTNTVAATTETDTNNSPTDNPKTGDAGMVVYLAAMGLSAVGLAKRINKK